MAYIPVRYPNVVRYGTVIAVVNAPCDEVERWIRSVSNATKIKLDWQLLAGMPSVMCLGTTSEQEHAKLRLRFYAYKLNGVLLDAPQHAAQSS